MNTKNFFLFLITLIILSGCSGAKDALQGKKRSDTSDEFLIEKKNPLTKPPAYNELPVPISEENSYTENNEADAGMEFYNSDGSTSDACGNGTRCVAYLLSKEKNKDEINLVVSSTKLKSKILRMPSTDALTSNRK